MGEGERCFLFTQWLSVNLDLFCVLLLDVLCYYDQALTDCGYLFVRYHIYYFIIYINNSHVVAQWQNILNQRNNELILQYEKFIVHINWIVLPLGTVGRQKINITLQNNIYMLSCCSNSSKMGRNQSKTLSQLVRGNPSAKVSPYNLYIIYF